MTDDKNICGQRISYELPEIEGLSDYEKRLYNMAVEDAEDRLAIIDEIQQDRINEAGEIVEPLSFSHARTIFEIGLPLAKSLAIIEAFESSTNFK